MADALFVIAIVIVLIIVLLAFFTAINYLLLKWFVGSRRHRQPGEKDKDR